MSPRTAIALIVPGVLALAGAATAQSFNIDIHSSPGFGAAVPSSTYAGAAAQPGTWNSVGSASPTNVALVNLDGSASSVTLTRATNGSFVNTSNLFTSGNFSSLFDDYQKLSPQGTLVYTFNNLQAGDYVLFTYAANPDDASSDALVSVPGSSSLPTQTVGGAITGNFWIPGTTHAIHVKRSVAAGGSITVNILADSLHGFACCNGLQLVKIPTGSRFRFYVNDNAAGIDAGGSWTDAYTDLQMALGSVLLAGGTNTEIWTAQGFYYPGTSRSSSFHIPADTQLYGGFQGTETSLAQRTSPAVFITAMSGGIGTGADTDNCYNVVTIDDGGSPVIDGFSIARGYANGVGVQSHGGGVVVTADSTPVFRNCKFLSNTAQSDGGGVYVTGATAPWFINCLFYDNSCNNATGGGLYTRGTTGAFRIINCQFMGNYAIGDGGGFVAEAQGGEVINTIFSGNTAGSSLSKGGAAMCRGDGGTVNFRGCTMSHNLCGGGTGGVEAVLGTDITFTNCILWDNANFDGPGSVNDNIEVAAAQGSTYTTSFTTVQGLAGVNGQNPLFVDANGGDNTFGTTDDNRRLQITSPCIDAGDSGGTGFDYADLDADGITLESTPRDLDMNARRVDISSVSDTGAGAAPQPDRGAYETPVPPCPGDFNANGQRNTNDLVLLLVVFGQSVAPGSTGDMNGDGFVSTPDLTAFLAVFGQPCP